MSNPIGFNQLFNKGDFQQGLTELKDLIARVKAEIDEATRSAGSLNNALGSQLKTQVASLSSNSTNLDAELRKVRNDFDEFKKSVSTTTGELTKYQAANDVLTKKVLELDKALQGQGSTQAKTTKVVKESTMSYTQLAQAMVGVGTAAALMYRSVQMLGQEVKAAYTSAIEFESMMKQVQAATMASGESFRMLVADANRLGASTEKTSTEIGSLQQELAKLGFTVEEILASSTSIVDLSTATGEGLAGSAVVAAATLRAFGLEAVEMDRVVNVMTGSFVRSGLDLEKFRESMKLVAPIARANNIELEFTTAALSRLADAGLSGSLAGTALRNLFSNMSSDATKLGERVGFAVKSSQDFIKAMKQLRDQGMDLAEAQKYVDVRARPAFFILMNQIDAVERLNVEYKILDGEGRKIANMMRATLANDIEIANSAFDAFRRNLVEDTLPAVSSMMKGLTTLGEFFRYMVSDVRSAVTALKEADGILSNIAGTIAEEFSFLKAPFTMMEGLSESVENSNTATFFKDIRIQAEGAKEQINAASADLELMGSVTASLANKHFHVLNAEAVTLDKRFEDILKSTLTEEEKLIAIRGRLLDSVQAASNLGKQYEVRLDKAKKELTVLQDVMKEEGMRTKKSEEMEKRLKQEIIWIENVLAMTGNRAKLEAEILKLKQAGIIVDEESLKNVIKIEEARRKAYIEELKTAELRAKIALENRKGKDDEIDYLETYGKARQKVITAEYNDEVERISATTEDEREATLLKQVAYQKYIQKKLGLEQDFWKSLKALSDQAVEDMQKATDEMLKAQIERVERLVKAYENAYKDIVKLDMSLPLEETAREHMESTLEFHKQRWKIESEGFGKIFRLKKQIREIEKIGESQGGTLESQEMDRYLILQKELFDMQEMTRRAIANGIGEVSRGVTLLYDNAAQARENELVAIDRWAQERIRLAGDNEEAIAAIELEAEERRKQIRRQQAKADKQEALFQIALNTAVNIVKAGGKIWEIIAVAAIGAAQAAIVASKPLPEFYKGTDNSPEGFARVGERGRELKIDGKTGSVSVTPSTETIQYLNKGTVIIPHDRTEQILSQMHPDHNGLALSKSYSAPNVTVTPQIDYGKLVSGFKDAVTTIPLHQTNFDERGVSNYVIKRKSKIELLNKRYRF